MMARPWLEHQHVTSQCGCINLAGSSVASSGHMSVSWCLELQNGAANSKQA
jgi:hypothetical protein